MIGNTYYFLDIIEIKELKESDFLGKEAWDDWRRWAMEQSIPWFEKSFADGMILAGRNYCHYYQHGRGNLIPPEPEKEVPIMRQGAERGYPEWMYAYAHYLAYTEDNDKEALPWALKAAEAGHLWSWHIPAKPLLPLSGCSVTTAISTTVLPSSQSCKTPQAYGKTTPPPIA